MADWWGDQSFGGTGLSYGGDLGYTPSSESLGDWSQPTSNLDYMGGGQGLYGGFGSEDPYSFVGLSGLDDMGGGQGLFGGLDLNSLYGFSGLNTGGLNFGGVSGNDTSGMIPTGGSTGGGSTGGSTGGGILGSLSNLGSSALNYLGQGNNATDLSKLLLGGLGLYGNWRASEEDRASREGMSAAELALRRELGLGELGLGRDRMSNEREIANEKLALEKLLGTGQLGQGQQRIDLERLLGTGRLDLDKLLGTGQLSQGQQRIDLDKLLGTGQLGLDKEKLALERLLGTGRLSVDQQRLALDKLLGTGQLGQGQQRIDLDKLLGTGQLDVDRGKLALEQELGRGNLALQGRGVDLEEDKFGLGQGVDEMASKALGMQLLINRGRMTSGQANPWLNMMYTGRQQMFGQDPELSKAFAKNPYGSMPVGAASQQPTSANQFFLGLDPFANQAAPKLPQMREGGLSSYNNFVSGGSGGQDDVINAQLSDGEYVFDADVVAALGDGNSNAGAAKLDKMREKIRKHKRSAPANKIPPKAKDPLKYLGD